MLDNSNFVEKNDWSFIASLISWMPTQKRKKNTHKTKTIPVSYRSATKRCTWAFAENSGGKQQSKVLWAEMVSPRILQKLPTQSNDLIWNNGNNEFDNENEKQQQVAISALMNLSGEKGIQASFTICHDHQFDTDFNLYSISKWVILSMLTHTKKHVITLKCNQISSIKIKSCNNNATPNTEVSHVNTRIYGMHGLNKWNQKMKEPKAYTHQIHRLAHYFQHIYVHSGRFAAQFSVCCRVVVSEFPQISFICWLGKRKKSKEKSIIQQLSTQKIWRWATKQPLERSKKR